LAALPSATTWKLFTTRTFGANTASGLYQGSGVYDPRAGTGRLFGANKSLAICEVCWILPDQAPERSDVALQPAGVIESSIFTSTSPS
jgi:hypothetical protein